MEGGFDGIGKETDLFNTNNLTGAGPSEHEMNLMTEKVQEEFTIIKEMKGMGGPTNPLEWFCEVTHLSFDCNQLKNLLSIQPDSKFV